MPSMLSFQPPGFEQRTIALSLGTLVYYTPSLTVSSGTPLVFLHSLGGGSSAYEWSKVYPAFAGQTPVLAPDLIGWGASSHPARDYQVEDYLTLLTEFLEQVVATPAIVIAASLTAGLVMRLAIQRPDLFRELWLCNPSGYGDFGRNYRQGLSAQLAGTPGLDQLIYTLGAANELAVRNFLQQFLFARPERINHEMVAAYLASAQQPQAEYAALASLKGNLCFDLSLYITQLQIPTVFLWGEAARFTSLETGERLAKLNPEWIKAFHKIPEAGVLPHLELPAVIIGLLQSHLQRGSFG